jgi:Leucine-rich repeat (LRR) protein
LNKKAIVKLYCNKIIDEHPKKLDCLSRIETVNVKFSFELFSIELCKLPNLKSSSVRNSEWKQFQFPRGIRSLQYLQKLDLSNNHLTILPINTVLITNLTQLSVRSNKLKKFQKELPALNK